MDGKDKSGLMPGWSLPHAAISLRPRKKRVLSAKEAAERDARVSRRSSFDAAMSYKDVGHLCRDFAESIGYETFLYAMVVPILGEEPGKITINGYPKAWVDIYNKRHYMRVDPVVMRALSTFEPFEWHEIDFSNAEPDAIELFQTAATFGICSGMSLRGAGAMGVQGILNMSTSDPGFRLGDRREEVFSKAAMFASRALEATLRVVEMVEEVGDTKLTTRQLQAIVLAGAGKSNKIIASQMGISEAGVEYLLRQVQEKWKVRNRVEAIAHGIKTGIIIDLNHNLLKTKFNLDDEATAAKGRR